MSVQRAGARDYLSEILTRTRRQNERRRGHGFIASAVPEGSRLSRESLLAALRRPPGAAPRIIAEIKFRSPSAGEIRPWSAGEAVRIARGYERAGAVAVSMLADAPGFGGSNLAVRRVSRACSSPVLYKGFVLEEAQLELARSVGARMVLLLVRALSDAELDALVRRSLELGLEPVVEAADGAEIDRALATPARVLGVNARDLASFRVDLQQAADFLEALPSDRIGVLMSGVRGNQELALARESRADAVLVGEALMRAPEPGRLLTEWLS
ncbi:MAG: indole-3-glycerol-phosphate synthase [Myxococcales bacterium]|nr:indole-3-glycerol-phosphate synthase [Myxococcales bacterium]